MRDPGEPLERWVYDDDEHGRVEVVAGPHDALRRLDPGWPEAEKGKPDAEEADSLDWKREPGDMVAQGFARLATRRGRLAARVQTVLEAGEKGMLVTVGGRTVARRRTVTSHRAPLAAGVKSGTFSDVGTGSAERVRIRANSLTHEILEVHLHHNGPDGREIVALAPPPGSKGERRAREMEASPWKRLVYPLAGGVGKAGWAVAMLVMIPLIGRLVGWLWGLVEPHLPEFEIPWPEIRLPGIPWPDWDLPSIPWPDIDLPDITLPAWIAVVMEYQKIWLPILLGLVLGVLAWRRQKKARRAERPDDAEQSTDEPDREPMEQEPPDREPEARRSRPAGEAD